jgi:hypothetical protein
MRHRELCQKNCDHQSTEKLIGVGPAVILSATEAVALQTRSCPVITANQLFLCLKLGLLAEQLRIAGVFRQKRHDRS